jgi:prevent-host-death family protein
MQALVEVSISGHNGFMKKVRVAVLKAKLSHYLRLVRKGETVTVYDRDKPVAEIVPIQASRPRLQITGPEPGAPNWWEVDVGEKLPPELARELLQDFLRDRETER